MGQQEHSHGRPARVLMAALGVLASCNGDDAPAGDGGSSSGATAITTTSAADGTSGASTEASEAGDETAAPDGGVPIAPTCDDAEGGGALELLGAGEGVHVGDVLGLSIFTIEAHPHRRR